MDDSQAGGLGVASPSQPMPSFDNFPDSNFSQTAKEPTGDLVLNSQITSTQGPETQGIQINFSQTQVHGLESLLHDNTATQLSEMFEPTQDGGFHDFTPLKERFVEPPASTIATVVLQESQGMEESSESPLVRRAGKLRRRTEVVSRLEVVSENEDEDEEELDEFGFGTSAFSVMKDAAIKEKKKEAFVKKTSKAKEMVDDQAEESEDEYAGLGGADGEFSDDDDAASVQEMIDDDTKVTDADDAKLAALHA
jgi:mediator of replication checkpoint protein 1